MRNRLFENRKVIEENSYELWKGNGADIGSVSAAIHSTADIILSIVDDYPEEDKTTTIQYIKSGLQEWENAYNNRDDFLLADCLYYIWRELIMIFEEALEGEKYE